MCKVWHKVLSLSMEEVEECPECAAEWNPEIGPDEVMEAEEKMRIVEGAEKVEKMDALLSLAITGGDYNWI